MSIKKYLADHWIVISMAAGWLILMTGLLAVFQVNSRLILILVIVFCMMAGTVLLWDLFRKKRFFDELKQNLSHMDQKYLVLETLCRNRNFMKELCFGRYCMNAINPCAKPSMITGSVWMILKTILKCGFMK